ncbi:hypothetical protein SeLEV6574_g03910 [Synchytrium endobioticum]|uniref:4-coumarate--CoA ligase n=1 Tax=Synchytrium endobioticum TaxID=286115 RepID=A0A507D1L0_9FUNG|nr:hypothetical protein SeLEV6574_g03910 [Synchytrium endobioticum]
MPIFSSECPAILIPKVDVYSFLFDSPAFAAKAHHRAVVDLADASTYTYAEIKDRVHRLAAGLHRQGFEKGHVLAVYAQNALDYPTVLFAVLKVGGIVSPANPTYTPDELAYQLKDARANFLVTQSDLLHDALLAASAAGIHKDRIFLISRKGQQGFHGLDDVLTDGLSPHVPLTGDAAAAAVAYLCYSSGTTGRSKGVMTSHYNIVANVCQVLAFESDYGPGDVWMGFLPFYHIYALTWILHVSIAKGISVLVMKRFDLLQYLEAVQTYRVTHVHCAPPVAIQMAKNPLVTKYNLKSIRMLICAAAPLSAQVAQEVYDKTNIPIKQAYGMTEASPISHVSPNDNIIVASCGKLVPNMEARIVSVDTKQDLGIGEEGELWLRGPNIMLGYHNNHEATRNTITSDGWLMTGDIGKVDGQGNYYITDRLKELIKVKGFQVAPADLEALLLTHPGIADAAVIGVPDPYSDQVPKAFVVPKPDATLSSEQVMSYVEGKVAPHKRLKGGVELIHAIPRNPSGKILRRDLRALEVQRRAAVAAKL